MARGFLRTNRTYNYIDKNPVIDRVRTIIQDEGLIKKLDIVDEISGVSSTTLRGWFDGDTRDPKHRTIAAVITSFGYREEFVKDHDINIERERKLAAEWLEKQERKGAIKKTKTKTNGHGRPAKRRK